MGASTHPDCPIVVMPVAAMAQGSPFDTGFTAFKAFSRTIAKVASLVAIVIGGYGSPRRTWCEKGTRRSVSFGKAA